MDAKMILLYCASIIATTISTIYLGIRYSNKKYNYQKIEKKEEK
jgi:hypothetical protein